MEIILLIAIIDLPQCVYEETKNKERILALTNIFQGKEEHGVFVWRHFHRPQIQNVLVFTLRDVFTRWCIHNWQFHFSLTFDSSISLNNIFNSILNWNFVYWGMAAAGRKEYFELSLERKGRSVGYDDRQ